MLRAIAIVCLLGGLARADDPIRIEVAVGDTVERDVGFAMGLMCDDLSVIRAELVTSTSDSNSFRVTGLVEGTTTCRVGTAPTRPAYVFSVHVMASRRRG